MGLCSGKDSLPVDFPKPSDNENSVEVAHPNIKPFSVHPLPLTKNSDVLLESSNGSDSLKEEKTITIQARKSSAENDIEESSMWTKNHA